MPAQLEIGSGEALADAAYDKRRSSRRSIRRRELDAPWLACLRLRLTWELHCTPGRVTVVKFRRRCRVRPQIRYGPSIFSLNV